MKQRLWPLAVTGALIVAAIVMVVVAGSNGRSRLVAIPTAPIDRVTAAAGAPGFLVGPNRSSLRICVAAIDGTRIQGVTADFLSAIESIREELTQTRYAQLLLDQLAEATVSPGCPPAAALDDGNHVLDPKNGQPSVNGPIVNWPSPYRIHVYIVSPETFRRWFGDLPYGHGTEEMFCGLPRGASCFGVTDGLYFTSNPAPALIADALRGALGLGL